MSVPRGLVSALLAAVLAGSESSAQTWNDARSRDLVSQATARRARQLADTGLADYVATAHGYLTFLAQLGEGFPDPPKVVKADEIALQVYWRAPNFSKQWIVGRRDTLVLPTDIQYHRDHLGIVQNNFPDIIRLGEGDEVRDVAHPLSAAGLAAYDFAISDSLRLTIPGKTIDVFEVKLRPRDQSGAAAVGALYLAREDAQVVRMAFSFTRAALIDRELEDVSIVIENALIDGRFWLPRRQEIEIRRTGSWMDFPARGIIRGRWEICCYHVNQGQRPAEFFVGPEIVQAPPAVRAAHRWEGRIVDSLPAEATGISDRDVRRVQAQARALVQEAALTRARRTALSAGSLSDLVRVSRAEGLSLGAGIRRRLVSGLDASLTGRFGFADHEAKGAIILGWRGGNEDRLELRGFREYREAGDVPEASRLRNTIAAQEFGSDYTDPVDFRGGDLTWRTNAASGVRWSASVAYEYSDSVRVMARPTRGAYESVIPARSGHGPRFSVRYERGAGSSPARGQWRLLGEARIGHLTTEDSSGVTFGRAFGALELERPLAAGRLLMRASAGAAWSEGSLPAQEYLLAGGPISAPGYRFHRFAGARLATLRAEWWIPVGFLPIPLGRWGSAPGRASLVPLANAIYVGEIAPYRPTAPGWYPSVGLGLNVFFDLLRIDVARGLRGGRWTFDVDVTRDFWRIL